MPHYHLIQKRPADEEEEEEEDEELCGSSAKRMALEVNGRPEYLSDSDDSSIQILEGMIPTVPFSAEQPNCFLLLLLQFISYASGPLAFNTRWLNKY